MQRELLISPNSAPRENAAKVVIAAIKETPQSDAL